LENSPENGGRGGEAGTSLCAHDLRTLHVRTNGLSAFKMLTLGEDADDDEAGEMEMVDGSW